MVFQKFWRLRHRLRDVASDVIFSFLESRVKQVVAGFFLSLAQFVKNEEEYENLHFLRRDYFWVHEISSNFFLHDEVSEIIKV